MQASNIKGTGQQLSVTRQAIVWGASQRGTFAVLDRKHSRIVQGWVTQKIKASRLRHSANQSSRVEGGCRRTRYYLIPAPKSSRSRPGQDGRSLPPSIGPASVRARTQARTQAGRAAPGRCHRSCMCCTQGPGPLPRCSSSDKCRS